LFLSPEKRKRYADGRTAHNGRGPSIGRKKDRRAREYLPKKSSSKGKETREGKGERRTYNTLDQSNKGDDEREQHTKRTFPTTKKQKRGKKKPVRFGSSLERETG